MTKEITDIKTTKLESANIIIPFIFPKENFSRTRLDDILTYPLAVFNKTKRIMKEKRLYYSLKMELKKNRFMEKFKPIRGKIEDFFKLLKQGLNMREIYKYAPKSVEKTVYLNVFLGALTVSQGFYSTAIQNYLKTKIVRPLDIFHCITSFLIFLVFIIFLK